MSRFPAFEVFWRQVRDSELVAFGRGYSVRIVEPGGEAKEDDLTLWSAEKGGEEVAQPLRTDEGGRAVGANGELPWAEVPDYDVLIAGQRFPVRRGGGGEGGGGAVDSVNGKTGAVELTASDVGAQPSDSDLTAIAALETTPFGRGLLALADAAAGRTALGLGSAATQASAAFDAAGAAAAAQAASQPVDSDLTAIAALSTTEYGRSLLTAASAAAARTLLGLGSAAVEAASAFQPADSDLTSIASLSTQPFGRELLTLASAAAVRSAISAASVAELESHTGKSSGAHAATAISYAGNAGMSATTVEAAIDEIANEAGYQSPTFCLVPSATSLGSFFVNAPTGFTAKLIGFRTRMASGSCKLKVKRTTSGGSESEPMKEKEAKTAAGDHTPTSETLADKDELELICESVSTPGRLTCTFRIELVRT